MFRLFGQRTLFKAQAKFQATPIARSKVPILTEDTKVFLVLVGILITNTAVIKAIKYEKQLHQ
jgi:uncharacterized membrane protein YidH (DUF202 family)